MRRCVATKVVASLVADIPNTGIQYAWLYKHRHPKSLAEGDAKDDGTYWKFNKARQGWLWKNVWNEEIVCRVSFDRMGNAFILNVP